VVLATGKGEVVAFGLEKGERIRLPRAPRPVIATVADTKTGEVSVVASENGSGRIERWEPQPWP
jgi:hypothetical protein